MARRRAVLLAVLFTGLTAARSNAQELYLIGGVAANSRSPGWYLSESTPAAPAASNVISVTGGLGVWLPHDVAVEGSLSITEAQPIAWHYAYQFGGNADELTYDRDLPLIGLVRIAPLGRRSLSIEPVAGGGVSLHRGATFITADCGSGSQPTPCVAVTPPRRGDVQTTADWTLTLGADLAIRVSSRLSLGPGFRVNYIRRELFMTGFDHRGPYSGVGHLWGIGITARYATHHPPASSPHHR
jgi:hypothetical protein